MNQLKSQNDRVWVRLLGLVGAGAFVGVGTLALVTGHDGAPTAVVAGSGDAPTNTMYVQPTDSIMTLGATATWTTPTSVEPSPRAVPVIKAH